MKITIEQNDGGDWNVYQDDRYADRLSYDEMLGLVAALTMPDKRPCLQWMLTEQEHRHRQDYFESIKPIQ